MALFNLSRLFGTIAVCGMGAYCMYITNGETGIGWAILGVMLIWNTGFKTTISEDIEKDV